MGRVNQLLKKVGKGLAIAYLATQAVYRSKDVIDLLTPSPERAAIEERFNIKIQGPPQQFEDGSRRSRDYFLSTLEDESKKGQLPFDAIEFTNRPFYEKTPLEQIFRLISKPYSGSYNPITKTIQLETNDKTTLDHEIGHARSYSKLAKWVFFDTPLADSLETAMSDDSGQSLYKPLMAQLASTFILLEHVIADSAPDERNFNNNGFPSTYAQTNVHEHVAEVYEETRQGTANINSWQDTPRGKRVLQLLSINGIVDQEFVRYKELAGIPSNYRYDAFNEYAPELVDSVIKLTEAFQRDFPRSPNLPHVLHLWASAQVYPFEYEVFNGQLVPDAAARERYRNIIPVMQNALANQPVTYSSALLTDLGWLYKSIGDEANACRYFTAADQSIVFSRGEKNVRRSVHKILHMPAEHFRKDTPGIVCSWTFFSY